MILLATVGLVTADAVTYTSLHSYLLARADDSVDAADNGIALNLPGIEAAGNNTSTGASAVASLVSPGYCVQLRSTNGVGVSSTQCLPQVQQEPLPPPPKWPVQVSVPKTTTRHDAERVSYFTVPSVGCPSQASAPSAPCGGGGQYRIRASIEPVAPSVMILIAAPLTGLDSTLHHLLVVEVFVTVGVLLALAILGSWVVRIGLRPLEAIRRTAATISHGDLSQRIERTDEKTEVGRLGLVLNTMLSQIESGFRAREATEQKLRRFVADASHELRTPLAAVRAYAELFSRGASSRPDDLARSMQGITRESERMSALVDELILLAHLDDGRPLRREEVDLEDVVSDSVDTAQAVEPDRPFTMATEQAIVTGDRDRLRQLVDNLLANVRAHTPPGAPVRVALSRTEGSAVLSVTDSGPGMSADEAAHVFERFYRADVSRSRSSGGSGLGLAIVSAIAEAHGGAAAVKSEPGHGATFTITLPLAAVESRLETGVSA
ncbi:MAG TPA: HAMP domain-containing sensor histidine kinase [Gaiellaceae bacterium]|nr:HAMP domain-containing sensor histidine kinase [Gaiellaceae bacterium]